MFWAISNNIVFVFRSNVQRKSARLVVVTKEDISMYSGSRERRFTDMSPSLTRYRSEFIPTSKSRIYRSKKFMLLTR